MTKNSDNIIAFMGVAGANADLACRKSEPYMETLPCSTFEAVFEAVRDGKARIGMLPMENSHAGRVSEIHNLLPEMGLHIVGEHFLPVQHVLAAPTKVKIKDITEAYSHPQALMQCHKTLQKHTITANASSNTAVAAQQVKEWGDSSKAALCSELAAELYGLEIIEANMQDSNDNVTTFIKVARDMLEDEELEEGSTMILTSIVFELRNIPAALYKALGGFATNNVNMLKLESYVAGGASPTAQFLVTFEGKPDDVPVQLTLEELGFFTKKIDVLGVYPAAADRTHFNI
ncbi:MAG: prephenate dehydratase domain-containing protein [Rickettsiales bacterium]|nr:prephenate dehydratase domain-containing protein [Rickettsiales bacterium]